MLRMCRRGTFGKGVRANAIDSASSFPPNTSLFYQQSSHHSNNSIHPMAVNISWALVGLTLFLLLARYVARYLHVRAFMARTGCLPPRIIDGGILGTKTAKETTAALEKGQYLALLRKRFARMGNTYQGNLLGLPFVATIEPENVKAIFTRIEDFTKEGRKTDWWPLLQGGILIADGMEWKKSRVSWHHLNCNHYYYRHDNDTKSQSRLFFSQPLPRHS